jgi:hypothetical protein
MGRQAMEGMKIACQTMPGSSPHRSSALRVRHQPTRQHRPAGGLGCACIISPSRRSVRKAPWGSVVGFAGPRSAQGVERERQKILVRFSRCR